MGRLAAEVSSEFPPATSRPIPVPVSPSPTPPPPLLPCKYGERWGTSLPRWGQGRPLCLTTTGISTEDAKAVIAGARTPPLAMLRWLIGGGREPQGLAEVKARDGSRGGALISGGAARQRNPPFSCPDKGRHFVDFLSAWWTQQLHLPLRKPEQCRGLFFPYA